MGTTYVYTEIQESNTIRVITLLPSRNATAPLQIKLREVLLTNENELQPQCAIPFVALSYTWGAEDAGCDVLCDDKQIAITQNCDAALRALRFEDDSRELWIDAICIDQSSNKDKSQQLAMMGEIYRRAHYVTIWLGTGDKLTAAAYHYLYCLASARLNADKGSTFKSRWWQWRSYLAKKAEFGDSVSGYICDTVMDNVYFTRVWTVQESALAKTALVMCGQSVIRWADFIRGVNIFLDRPTDVMLQSTFSEKTLAYIGHWQATILIFRSRRPEFRTQSVEDVWQVLDLAHMHQCKMPHDKVYGLQAIFKSIGIELPKPDYAKSESSVYIETFRAIIEQTRSLGVYDNSMKDQQSARLPSWVHDLNKNCGQPIPRYAWRATKGSLIDTKLLRTGPAQHLRLKGIEYDTVETIAAKSFPLDLSNNSSHSVMRRMAGLSSILGTWLDCYLVAIGDTGSKDQSEDLLFQAVTLAEEPPGNLDYRQFWGLSLADLWKTYCSWSEGQLDLSHNPIDPHTMFACRPPDFLAWPDYLHDTHAMWYINALTGPDTEQVLHLMLRFSMTHRQRRFFLTRNGHAGIGPCDMEAGDRVVLLAGARMPMILRETGHGFFRLLGTAYVHGIMSGQAWPDHDREPWPVFVIV